MDDQLCEDGSHPVVTSTAGRADRGAARTNRALAVLGFVAFVIGTAELLVVGILDLVASDVGASISTAGQLVTGYALGIAFGGPIFAALTRRLGRRSVLCAALVAFLVGNVLAVLATGFGILLAVRILTGSLHGLVAGVATGIAASLVEPEHRGRAISMVVGGITVSTVVGVPLGTLIGQALGWRAAFAAMIALGALALVATMVFVPAAGGSGRIDPRPRDGGSAFAPRVALMLAVGLLLFAGQFTAFTYLTPFLATVTGVSGTMVSVFLLAFGVAATVGTFLGGRAADRDASAALLAASIVLTAAMGGLYLVGSVPLLVVPALAAWGLAGFAIPPALLLRAVTLAGSGGDQAATLGISAANAGIVVGSMFGGVVIGSHDARATVLVATAVCAVAVPAVWATRFLRPPAVQPVQRVPVELDTHACCAARLALRGP